MSSQLSPYDYINELGKFGIRPLLPPESLIYKYVSFDIALEIIENNELLFSPPSSFNDPFDLTNSLIDKTYTKDDLKEWLNNFDHLPKSQKKHLFEENRKNPTAIRNMLNSSLDKLKSQMGITCFSKSHNKTLMWSHYANKHTGVCLGFNILPIGIKNFTLLNVNYMDKIVPLNYFKQKQIALMYWLYTKSHVWKYEEEVRAIFTDQNGLIKFEKAYLKEVYFGLKTTQPQRVNFITRLNELNYKVSKLSIMKMSSKTFDLVESNLP